jgi:hypothetical protein
MGLFKKKADPISDRTKALNAQIAALEAQIKKLDGRLHREASEPRSRPHGISRNQSSTANHQAAHREPIFEAVDHRPLQPAQEESQTPDHFNDLGVRKYDFSAAWKRWRNQFRAPPASNPKLVTYLVAGSIKGLRPLRYEKRVARNRFIALFLILVCLLWGIISAFIRTH